MGIPRLQSWEDVNQAVLTDQPTATRSDLTETRLGLEVKLEQLRVELHRELGSIKNELGFLRWAAYVFGALLIPVFLRTVLKL